MIGEMSMFRTITFAASALAMAAVPVAAQAGPVIPVAVEAHGGASIPGGTWKDHAKSGVDYGVAVRYNFAQFFGVYAGYDGRTFDLKPAALPNGAESGRVVDSGMRAGVQLSVPTLGVVPVQPFVEAGGLLNTTRYDYTAGTVTEIFTSNFGVGYEFGGGLALHVVPRVAVVPEVRYRSFKPGFNAQDSQFVTAEKISALSLDIGVRVRP
jgi:outer membrane protein with beta-barrel domain